MIEALIRATRAQFRTRMLALVLLPLIGSLLLWLLIYALAWHQLVDGLQQTVEWAVSHGWIGDSVARVLSEWIVLVIMLMVLLPLTQATSLLIASTIAMPMMVDDVARRDFPALERRRGGSTLGSIVNAVVATVVYLALWLLTLPLWLFGLPALVLPVLLNAWLNARLFHYDALAEHAGREEWARVTAAARGQWFGLGVVAALLQSVPVVNLFVPVYAGLSFIYLALGRLQRLRAA